MDESQPAPTSPGEFETLTDDEFERALATLMKRSQTDLEFRELCLRDAVAAIRVISGKNPPAGKLFQFGER